MKGHRYRTVLLLAVLASTLTSCALLVAPPTDVGGYVLSVESSEVLVDLTAESGVEVGMELAVLQRMAPGEPMQVLGSLRVTAVGNDVSRCELLGRVAVRPGDLVRTRPKTFVDGDEHWQPQPIHRRGENWVNGPLAFDEVWSGTVYLTGDVTVPYGVTLTVSPATKVLVRLPKGKGTHQTTLTIEGRLMAIGEPDAPIHFGPEIKREGAWRGIQFRRCREPETSVLKHTTISQARVGCDLFSSSAVQFEQVALRQNNLAGVRCEQSSPTIRGCTFQRNLIGMGCTNGAHPLIEQNLFEANSSGIDLNGDALPTIRGNRFVGNTTGIQCINGSQPQLERNVIRDNTNGVWCADGASPTLWRNIIADNKQYGIMLEGLRLGMPTIKLADAHNAIYANRHYDLMNQTSHTVDARGCWWGTADLLAIDRRIYDDEEDTGDQNQDTVVSGQVLIEPCLTRQPQ